MAYWYIVWRDKTTGNIFYTGLSRFNSWDDADAALSTLLSYRKLYTPTIETAVS